MHCGDLGLFSLPRIQSQIDGHQKVGCPDKTWFLLFWSSWVCILLPVSSWSQVLSQFLAEQHLINDIATSTLHCPLLFFWKEMICLLVFLSSLDMISTWSCIPFLDLSQLTVSSFWLPSTTMDSLTLSLNYVNNVSVVCFSSWGRVTFLSLSFQLVTLIKYVPAQQRQLIHIL